MKRIDSSLDLVDDKLDLSRGGRRTQESQTETLDITVIKPNSLCHADCLAFLSRLDKGVARTVYLDPPWLGQPALGSPTAGARVAGGLRDYLDNFARVLQHCHRVLAEDGSIVVHADRSLAQKFGLLLGQVFLNGHIDDYILPFVLSDQGTRHATLLHYSKCARPVLNRVFETLPEAESEQYNQSDENGAFRVSALTSGFPREAFQFEWKGFSPQAGGSWRYSREELG